MACINCSNCSKATPRIPECTETAIIVGLISGSGDFIVRITNVASNAVWEQVVSVDLSGTVQITLGNFGDLTAFQSSQGLYAIEVFDLDMTLETITDYNGGVNTAPCVLVEFVPLDNSGTTIILGF